MRVNNFKSEMNLLCTFQLKLAIALIIATQHYTCLYTPIDTYNIASKLRISHTSILRVQLDNEN